MCVGGISRSWWTWSGCAWGGNVHNLKRAVVPQYYARDLNDPAVRRFRGPALLAFPVGRPSGGGGT